MKRILSFVEGLLFPPVCRGCGERQSIFADDIPGPLCPTCLARFRVEGDKPCPICGQPRRACRCTPPILLEAGAELLCRLSEYRPDKRTLTTALILRCKDYNDRALFGLWAEELAAVLLPQLTRPWEDKPSHEEVIVTYVPRRPSSVRAVGHDQAASLAGAIARRLGVPCIAALAHKSSARRAQKTLNAEERLENAQQSYQLTRRGNALAGKTVVLVDDVCTTGASLAACVGLLKAAGAERIICCVVGETEREG